MRHVLIDTQIFLWMQFQSQKLPSEIRSAMSASGFCWHLSQVSLWEIQTKCDLGKLPLPEAPEAVLPRLVRESGLAFVPLENDAVFMLGKLPKIHRDPFDRLLLTTCIVRGWELATADATMERYPVKIFRSLET